jgi:tight adherence protein B
VLTVLIAIAGPLTCVLLVRAARRAESGARVLRLRSRARRTLPIRLRLPLERALHTADVHIEPESAVLLWLVATLSATLLCSSVAPGLVIPVGLGVVVSGPVALHLARGRVERRFASSLPIALEQVAAELRGGGTVASALDRLAAAPGPVAADVRRVQTRIRLGLSLGDSLAAWPGDHDAPGVRAAAGALAVAATLGGRAADAVDGLAASLRHRLDAAAEARALSAQARLSAIVVGTAPIAYLAFSGLVDPGSASALVGTDVGRVCLVLGSACEVLAALWIRRILRSEA